MPFATRAELLKLSNVERLAQLAVPTDKGMPDEQALRVALEGGDLNEFTEHDQELVALALTNIDQALIDASASIVSYGIPATVVDSLIKRYCAQIAIYMLADMQNSVNEQTLATYNAVISQLKLHARGDIQLIPPAPGAPALEDDLAVITSGRQRYFPTGCGDDWDEI